MTSDKPQSKPAGMPGDGTGRRDETGHSGVHPASAGWPDADMEIRREGEWGQGERGLEGYENSGESELSMPASTPGAEVVAGEPGPADETAAGMATTEPAGRPGPTDEAVAGIEPTSPSVAGEPGPSDEANAALGIPVEGKE